MKLFGFGRKKGEDTVVDTEKIVETTTEETIEEVIEEATDVEDTDSAVIEIEEEPEVKMEEESQVEMEEESEVETEEESEVEMVEESEVEMKVGAEEDTKEMDTLNTEKLDQEKSLEELDAEVQEEVRLTAMLPVEEVNKALETNEELSEKALKRKRIRKIILRSFGGIIGTILLVYLVGTVFFHYNFFYNTTVNGTDVSLQSVKGVHATLEDEVNNYELTMITSEGTKEVIRGDLMNMGYKESKDVINALDLQMAYKWPLMFFKERQFKIDVEITFNEDLLVEMAEKMDFANPTETIKPINAYPAYEDGSVIIVEEVYGNKLRENVGEVLIEAVYNLESELDLMDAKAYTAPEFTRDSEEVKAAVDAMHTFLNAEINYTEGDVLDSELIGTWLKVDSETLDIDLDSDKIDEYVKELESKYNTYSDSISFTNPVGKKATVKGGSYGFRVNKSSEAEQIINDIKSGDSVSRQINYSQKGSDSATTSNPFGDTYVCLDLTLQKVYMLYKGSVVLTSDCVTGSVAGGMSTPQGVYTLTYKTKNAVLRGDIQSDGSYGYESPVSYWMPFNGGIGFHDASWRSTYGGTIYKTNGSHGCVNMPLANAAKLYEYINSSMPIVCHY